MYAGSSTYVRRRQVRGRDRTEYSCGTSANCAADIPRLRRLCWQGRVRTCDLWINSPSLCQLSYLPLLCWRYYLVSKRVADCSTGTQLTTRRWLTTQLPKLIYSARSASSSERGSIPRLCATSMFANLPSTVVRPGTRLVFDCRDSFKPFVAISVT